MKQKILLDIGKRIRGLRENLKISQEELGHLANLHRTYIGAIERGERNPSVLSLEKIARVLKVNVGDLFND